VGELVTEAVGVHTLDASLLAASFQHLANA
jgi:hypothetical protein